MLSRSISHATNLIYVCVRETGHIYAIGECGGATEESKCPDCQATIGGTSHNLRYVDGSIAVRLLSPCCVVPSYKQSY